MVTMGALLVRQLRLVVPTVAKTCGRSVWIRCINVDCQKRRLGVAPNRNLEPPMLRASFECPTEKSFKPYRAWDFCGTALGEVVTWKRASGYRRLGRAATTSMADERGPTSFAVLLDLACRSRRRRSQSTGTKPVRSVPATGSASTVR